MTMPPAGWYPSPGEPGLLRWWDGASWAEHRQNATVAPANVAEGEPAVPAERAAKSQPRKRSRRRLIVAIAALAVGVAWLVALPILLGTFSSPQPAAGERAAAGTVVSVTWSEGTATYNSDGTLRKGSSGPACAAVVEAKVAGQKYQKQETAFQSPCAVKVGDSRAVFYDPENAAASMHVAPGHPRGLMQTVVPAAGVLPLIAGGILLVRGRKATR